MKLSTMRAKARSAFRHPRRIQYKDDSGVVHPTALAAGQAMRQIDAPAVEVVVIRGRTFTRPQTAKQRAT